MTALRHALAASRHLTPEPLNVAPGLIGCALASPRQRALAMGVDLLVVALISGASGLWLLAGLAVVLLLLRSRRGGRRWHPAVGWALVALFAALALQDLLKADPPVDEPVAAVPRQASAQAAREAAAELRADGLPGVARVVEQALGAESAPPGGAVEPGTESPPPSSAAASAPTAASLQRENDRLSDRVAELEAELAEARQPRPFSLRTELRRLADSVGATFGWGIVYFTLLPAFWNGQTLGKRLLGLQVVELAGQPMTVMRGLRRYGGYAAGMATGGLGFAQALWDVNRQAIQDRAAHTVVLDLRAPSAPALSASTASVPPPPAPVP